MSGLRRSLQTPGRRAAPVALWFWTLVTLIGLAGVAFARQAIPGASWTAQVAAGTAMPSSSAAAAAPSAAAPGSAAPAPSAATSAAGAASPSPSATAAATHPPGPRALPPIPGGKVTVVRIEGTIDLGLAPFLERVLATQAAEELLVLDISTLGGRLDAALLIRDALLHSRARTVCWINPRAISAGALISLACDVIAVAPGATIGAATPVQVGEGTEAKPVAEKVVSYMRKEMRATAEAKGRRGEIAEAMVDADVEIPGLDEKGKLLTLDGGQALAWGIAEAQAATEAELWQALGRSAPDRIDRPTLSAAEILARFLSEPVLSGLLMTLGMLGILLELYSPGHGVALTVGLICLGLFFFGHHVARLAGWEEIALFFIGAGLIGVEVFFPGHLLPGIAGALCVLIALTMAVINLEHVPIGVAWDAGFIPRAMATVFGSLTATAVLGAGAVRWLPRTRLRRHFILDAAIVAVAPGRDTATDAGEAGPEEALVGRIVTAATDLRPAGKVLLDGRRVEASAERGYIDKGAQARVIRTDGRRLIVRAADAPEQS